MPPIGEHEQAASSSRIRIPAVSRRYQAGNEVNDVLSQDRILASLGDTELLVSSTCRHLGRTCIVPLQATQKMRPGKVYHPSLGSTGFSQTEHFSAASLLIGSAQAFAGSSLYSSMHNLQTDQCLETRAQVSAIDLCCGLGILPDRNSMTPSPGKLSL